MDVFFCLFCFVFVFVVFLLLLFLLLLLLLYFLCCYFMGPHLPIYILEQKNVDCYQLFCDN